MSILIIAFLKTNAMSTLKQIQSSLIPSQSAEFASQINEIFEDVMKYAIEKGLQTSIFPSDQDGYTHLYALDEKTQRSYDLCEMIASANKRDSPGYNFELQKYKDIIDGFIENKDQLIQKQEKVVKENENK